jgi:hypothetical protein
MVTNLEPRVPRENTLESIVGKVTGFKVMVLFDSMDEDDALTFTVLRPRLRSLSSSI